MNIKTQTVFTSPEKWRFEDSFAFAPSLGSAVAQKVDNHLTMQLLAVLRLYQLHFKKRFKGVGFFHNYQWLTFSRSQTHVRSQVHDPADHRPGRSLSQGPWDILIP
ncbi:MAG: hypothetical protein HYY50_03335 [Candidatus Kerfeldbacteria bacterium]|nr:hypothetical protein [Candidatus Kerfeldbacteria bacterium]